MQRESMQFAMPRMMPFTKGLLIVSGVVFLLQLICATFLGFSLEPILGFVPARLLNFWLWQLFTYPFLHAGLFHLLFNLLVIWSIGNELEALWRFRTYLGFFLVCVLGAALFHGIFSLFGVGQGALVPVIGSSGFVYGLLLAFGILFGDRPMYFFMLFPMPARFFVLLLGGIELISSVFYGHDGISHLAHLGGMLFGFIFLMAMAAWRRRNRVETIAAREAKDRQRRLKQASHLRLVRPEKDEDDEPTHWH